MSSGWTVRRRLIAVSIGVLALYYGLVAVFSVLFMEPFSLHATEMSLVHAYEEIKSDGTYDLRSLARLEADSNINIVIADRSTMSVLYNSRAEDPFMEDMMARFLPQIEEKASAYAAGYYVHVDELYEHTSAGAEYSSGMRVMLGGITDEYLIDLSTPYSPITKATAITLRFSLLVGLAVMLLAALIYSHLSREFSQPLAEIGAVTQAIAGKDFSVRCQSTYWGEFSQMAQSVNQMADMIESYTQDLESANAQLREDIKEKAAQEEARRNLVSNLSHDLKTPIGLISGYAEGLRSGMAKTEEERQEYLEIISDEADHMLELTQRMMELFRLESGTVKLTPEDLSLSDLASSLAETFSLELQKADIRFEQDVPEDLYIHTDYFAAEQILTNFLQNAISHIGGEEKVLRLTAEEKGGSVRVSLCNTTAATISQEELNCFWQPFYRGDKSRGRKSGESGLGLAVVRTYADLLHIRVGASPAQVARHPGVCFWVEFPTEGA